MFGCLVCVEISDMKAGRKCVGTDKYNMLLSLLFIEIL